MSITAKSFNHAGLDGLLMIEWVSSTGISTTTKRKLTAFQFVRCRKTERRGEGLQIRPRGSIWLLDITLFDRF